MERVDNHDFSNKLDRMINQKYNTEQLEQILKGYQTYENEEKPELLSEKLLFVQQLIEGKLKDNKAFIKGEISFTYDELVQMKRKLEPSRQAMKRIEGLERG